MSEMAKIENLKECIKIREQKALLDSDAAQIYGVETKDINKAVTNNPDKFSVEYITEFSKSEK